MSKPGTGGSSHRPCLKWLQECTCPPDLTAGVRERIWAVVEDWFTTLGNGAVAMIWRDGTAAGGLALRHLGDPPKDIWDADGVLLVKRS